MGRVELASTPNGTLWGEKPDLSVELLPGATGMVYQHGTFPSAPVTVPVYAAETGPGQLTQPIALDDVGQLPGWCDGPATVDIVYTNGGHVADPAPTPLIPSDPDPRYDPAGIAAALAVALN